MEPIIIDNFLNELDFKRLSNLDLKKIKKNEIHVYHNQINLKNEVISECLTENIVRSLQNNYHEKAINLLKKLCPEKLSLYEYSEFHIIETGADYKYPIHDDTPNKLLSGVVYLKTVDSPDSDQGAIEFGLHGYDIPIIDENYPTTIHRPKRGDIVLFPSSLFHRTIPFKQDVDRCVIAFDLKPV